MRWNRDTELRRLAAERSAMVIVVAATKKQTSCLWTLLCRPVPYEKVPPAKVGYHKLVQSLPVLAS